jgi:hypothetical protein
MNEKTEQLPVLNQSPADPTLKLEAIPTDLEAEATGQESKKVPKPKGDWKMTVEEFSFAGCHYNSSCD